MLDKTATKFSRVKRADTPWRSDGLRDFFLYKDLGVADASHGAVIAHLVKANLAPEKGTGWHRHEAALRIVFMAKAGRSSDVRRPGNAGRGRRVHPPAPRHRPRPVRLLADMECLEIVASADFKSVDVAARCEVPTPAPAPR